MIMKYKILIILVILFSTYNTCLADGGFDMPRTERREGIVLSTSGLNCTDTNNNSKKYEFLNSVTYEFGGTYYMKDISIVDDTNKFYFYKNASLIDNDEALIGYMEDYEIILVYDTDLYEDVDCKISKKLLSKGTKFNHFFHICKILNQDSKLNDYSNSIFISQDGEYGYLKLEKLGIRIKNDNYKTLADVSVYDDMNYKNKINTIAKNSKIDSCFYISERIIHSS